VNVEFLWEEGLKQVVIILNLGFGLGLGFNFDGLAKKDRKEEEEEDEEVGEEVGEEGGGRATGASSLNAAEIEYWLTTSTGTTGTRFSGRYHTLILDFRYSSAPATRVEALSPAQPGEGLVQLGPITLGRITIVSTFLFMRRTCSATHLLKQYVFGKLNCSKAEIARSVEFTIDCSAVQCSAVQCSAVQCSAVQCAVQCSAERGNE